MFCLNVFSSDAPYTVSPRREATWPIPEGGLSSGFTSPGLYGENVSPMTGYSGL